MLSTGSACPMACEAHGLCRGRSGSVADASPGAHMLIGLADGGSIIARAHAVVLLACCDAVSLGLLDSLLVMGAAGCGSVWLEPASFRKISN